MFTTSNQVAQMAARRPAILAAFTKGPHQFKFKLIKLKKRKKTDGVKIATQMSTTTHPPNLILVVILP